VAAALCAVVVVALGAMFLRQRRGSGFDDAVDGWVYHQFGYDNGFLRAVLHLADLPVVLGALAAILVIGLMRGRREVAWLAVLGPSLAMVLTELLFKPLVHRTSGDYLAFPSGHTTGIVSVAAVLGVILLGARLHAGLRAVLVVPLVAAVVLVATALVGLDYHYFTDTVGGFCVGVGSVITVAVLLDRGTVEQS
jgi:membrane-associated phospholipid phosphatase